MIRLVSLELPSVNLNVILGVEEWGQFPRAAYFSEVAGP